MKARRKDESQDRRTWIAGDELPGRLEPASGLERVSRKRSARAVSAKRSRRRLEWIWGGAPRLSASTGGSAALSILVFVTIIGLVLPNAHAATPTPLSGSVVPIYSNPTSTVNKSGKTYVHSVDLLQFFGDIAGNCTGYDDAVFGLGPHNASDLSNNTGFVRDGGACTFVGSIAGLTGTIQLHYLSSTGFHTCAGCTTDFHFSGNNGTGNLASAQLRSGVLDTSFNYTADLEIG